MFRGKFLTHKDFRHGYSGHFQRTVRLILQGQFNLLDEIVTDLTIFFDELTHFIKILEVNLWGNTMNSVKKGENWQRTYLREKGYLIIYNNYRYLKGGN